MAYPTPEEQIANRCKHFSGVHNKTCRAGIAYNDVRAERKLPCLKSEACPVPCASAEFPTEQEVAERARKDNDAIERYFRLLSSDICPTCEAKIERHQQIGRCVYALPCYHRLYQGKATKHGKDTN